MARKIGEWEVPDASAPQPDPWSAPGHASDYGNVPAGVCCTRCGRSLAAREMFALQGDLYCAEHRPAGAVSAAQLPPDPMLTPSSSTVSGSSGFGWGPLSVLGDLVIWILSAIFDE